MPSKNDLTLFADIALASGAAAAGVVDPALGVVAAGAAVGVSNRLRTALTQRAARNFTAAADGVRSAGIEVIPAIDALMGTDEGLALLDSAVQRLAVAAFADKARALGTCIGRGALGGTEVAIEAESVWAQLIDRLQRRHVVALIALREPHVEFLDPSVIHAPDHYTIVRESRRGSAFRSALGSFDTMTANAVRADLSGWGLARSVRGMDLGLRGGASESDTFWLPTDLGTQVTGRLQQDAGAANHSERSAAQ